MNKPIPTDLFAPPHEAVRSARQAADKIVQVADAEAKRVAALAEELREYFPEWPR